MNNIPIRDDDPTLLPGFFYDLLALLAGIDDLRLIGYRPLTWCRLINSFVDHSNLSFDLDPSISSLMETSLLTQPFFLFYTSRTSRVCACVAIISATLHVWTTSFRRRPISNFTLWEIEREFSALFHLAQSPQFFSNDDLKLLPLITACSRVLISHHVLP